MPSESLLHYAGTPATGLQITVSCPACGGTLTFDNGVRQSVEGVGIGGTAVLSCHRHGAFEVRVQLIRTSLRHEQKRPSGAQQRKIARQRQQVTA